MAIGLRLYIFKNILRWTILKMLYLRDLRPKPAAVLGFEAGALVYVGISR